MSYNRKQLWIHLSVGLFVFGAALLWLAPRKYFPEFYNPGFMGISALLSAIAVILPTFVLKGDTPQKQDAIANLQLYFAAALFLNSGGALGLYQLFKLGFQYDKMVHFAASMFVAMAFMEAWRVWLGGSAVRGMLWPAVLVVTGGVWWEFLEFFFDSFFRVQTLGFNGFDITRDSMADIIFNLLGIIAAVAVFLRKS